METRIHRTFGSSYPHTVLVLAQHSAATTTKTEADNDRLSIRSLNTEAGVTLAINLRPFLSWLVHWIGNEVLLGNSIVESRIKVLDGIVSLLGLVVLVERQRMVIDAEPRVAVAKIPEGHTVDDILMLAEDLEDASVLVGEQRVHITCHGLVLTT